MSPHIFIQFSAIFRFAIVICGYRYVYIRIYVCRFDSIVNDFVAFMSDLFQITSMKQQWGIQILSDSNQISMRDFHFIPLSLDLFYFVYVSVIRGCSIWVYVCVCAECIGCVQTIKWCKMDWFWWCKRSVFYVASLSLSPFYCKECKVYALKIRNWKSEKEKEIGKCRKKTCRNLHTNVICMHVCELMLAYSLCTSGMSSSKLSHRI